jgi:hypothetical protein
MDGHWPLGAQTDGKQALTVMLLVLLSGIA